MKPDEIVKSVAKAQHVADSPAAKFARKIAESPTTPLMQQVTESPTAQLARRVAQSPTGEAAKQATNFADELQAIRRQLATPEGAQAALAASKAARGVTQVPEMLKPWLRTPRGRGVVAPLPSEFRSPAVIPPPVPQKIDIEGLVRRANEIFAEDAEAKRELDRKMIEMMENMHAALVEANQREAEALDRAKAAEDREVAARVRAEGREGRMLKLTIGATVIAALSLICTVVAILVAANAGG
jgi:hypothetical protein